MGALDGVEVPAYLPVDALAGGEDVGVVAGADGEFLGEGDVAVEAGDVGVGELFGEDVGDDVFGAVEGGAGEAVAGFVFAEGVEGVFEGVGGEGGFFAAFGEAAGGELVDGGAAELFGAGAGFGGWGVGSIASTITPSTTSTGTATGASAASASWGTTSTT